MAPVVKRDSDDEDMSSKYNPLAPEQDLNQNNNYGFSYKNRENDLRNMMFGDA